MEAPAGADGVDGRLRGGEHPQPVADGSDPPAGFVGNDQRTAAHLVAQPPVERRRVAGDPMQQVRQPAGVTCKPNALRNRRATFASGTPSSVCRCTAARRRPDRAARWPRPGIGGLQRMPALDAPSALRAVAHLDVEAAHERAHHFVFLILRRDAGPVDDAATVRARPGGRRMGFVDPRRARSASLLSVGGARPASGTPAASLWPLLGEGGRLPATRTARRVELLLELLAASLPAVAILTQPGVLPFQLPNGRIPWIPLAPRRVPGRPAGEPTTLVSAPTRRTYSPRDGFLSTTR